MFWDLSSSTDDRYVVSLPTDTHDGGNFHDSIVCLNNQFVECLEVFEQNQVSCIQIYCSCLFTLLKRVMLDINYMIIFLRRPAVANLTKSFSLQISSRVSSKTTKLSY